VQRGARAHESLERQRERDQDGQHREEAIAPCP
jgi:hypothetical protein